MSTRTYNLRTRAEAGVANQPRARNESPQRQMTPSPTRDLPPYIVGGYPPVNRPTALYSDVVASRPPSPQKEASSTTVVQSEKVPEVERTSIGRSVPTNRAVLVNDKILTIPESGTSSEDVIPAQDTGDDPWTTVRRQRTRSLDAFEPVRKVVPEGNVARGLTREQVQTVQAATDTLTHGQKETIRDRQKKVTHRKRDSSSSSRGEGMSKSKGKGVDPREWGNVDLSDEDLDVGAQEAALRLFAHEKKMSKQKDGKTEKETHRTIRRDARSQSVRLPAASRPVAQLAQDSYLGTALRNVGRSPTRRHHHHRDDSSSPSSEPSSSDNKRPDSDSGSSSRDRSHRRRDN